MVFIIGGHPSTFLHHRIVCSGPTPRIQESNSDPLATSYALTLLLSPQLTSATMYLLRRAAVRALSQQTTRQLSTFRPACTPRIAPLQTSKATICRSFHQSRIWRAEEDKKEQVEEAKEESVEAAEVAEDAAAAAVEASADAAAATTESEVQQAQEVAEGESSIAADAASSAAAAATAATSSSAYPPEPTQRQQRESRRFPPDRTEVGASARGTPSSILYVGNLFFEVTASQLEAEFARIGNVINSRIVTDARGLSKGFGYIEFSDQSAADRAVQELDQKTFQGRRMAVQYHVARERRPQSNRAGGGPGSSVAPTKTLFIGNMSYQMSDKDLNDLFREIRDVLDVRVAIDRRTGQPRGFAHADFIDIPSAQRAKEILATKVIYGRQLKIDFSSAAPQGRREPRDQ